MNTENMLVESQITSELFSKATVKKIPLSGTFELTPYCNFSCNMCYIHKTVNPDMHPTNIMKKDDWLKIAKEAKKAGMLYLLLTGGEPLLAPDFWELYEKLSEMGFLISINTNGSLIDNNAIERFKKNPPIRINISLYGTSNETYEQLCHVKNGFERVDKAIRALLEAGIEVKLNGMLTPDNVGDLERCIVYAESKGLIYETTTYMFPPVRREETDVEKYRRFTPKEAAYYRVKAFRHQYGEERYHQFMKSLAEGSVFPIGLDSACIDRTDGQIRCRAGKAAFWISWDGYMLPCGMMPIPKEDIRKNDFLRCWKNLTCTCKDIRLSGVCKECSGFKYCSVCAAMALAETGSHEKVPTYLCQMVDALVQLANYERANKLFPDKPLL